ncbi:MAG TPA: glutamate-5-semialdehyde dehydrogenase [Campylobacterales bacterium]|nr:glutamate-5-semialdehyde dehydrogenase [Campylobacterales bacterium]
MQEYLSRAKAACAQLSQTSGKVRNEALLEMARAIKTERLHIIDANRKDMEYAKTIGLSSAMLDRLLLDEKRVNAMADSIETIATLRDPLGRTMDGWTLPNGLKIQKVSIPIGVVGVIYESRPNVTSDTAALCFKSGNVAVLKGGKEAVNSNFAIADILRGALNKFGLSRDIISMLPDSSREGVMKLVKMDKFVDLIIPRGGESLIRAVCENATVPVVKHDKGVCHIYLDESADMESALKIVINAKVQRPGVCNSMETLLVDAAIAKDVLPTIKAEFDKHATKLKGCANTIDVIDVELADDEDFFVEYGDNILNIKVVDGVEAAAAHIALYGSGHSDSIISENYQNVEYFLNRVDSACVYANASTRFTDGSEFGFAAEVGISTNKLHSRGPMGVNDLTTYKYKIYGNGQIRE